MKIKSPQYNIIQQHVSSKRLGVYEKACNFDREKTLKLYQANLRLSQSFYPLLSLLEVALRNAIDIELKKHFNDKNWLKNGRRGFMIDPSLVYTDSSGNPRLDYYGNIISNKYLVTEVNSTIKRIKDKEGIPEQKIKHDKILSSLSFGFWLALFDRYHLPILRGATLNIFNKSPKGYNAKQIEATLLRIRDFRNRIYHNEAIVFDKNSNGTHYFSLSEAGGVVKDIRDVFTWMNLDYSKWTQRVDCVRYEINCTKCLMKHYHSIGYYITRIKIELGYYKDKYIKQIER